MKQTLTLTTKAGNTCTLTLKTLDASYLPQILELQQQAIATLPDATWFASTSKEEFQSIIDSNGIILGYVTPTDTLVAVGVYAQYGINPDNYGYDLELDEVLLHAVGHIECTIVEENFRGNRLQSLLCDALEEIGRLHNTPLMCATVHPDNKYSLQTLLKRGYAIKKEKLKYGGLRRYILLKELL